MQRMNIFEAIKAEVTTRQAAEFYGLKINRSGKVSCPLHKDRTPSMKVDRRYHCFSCGADGDVIDFVSLMEKCGKYEAALRLSGYFGISFDASEAARKEARKEANERRKAQERKKAEHIANSVFFRALTDYLHDLEDIKDQSKNPEEDPAYLDAVSILPTVEMVADLYLTAIFDKDQAKQTEIRKQYEKALLTGRKGE